MDYNAKDWMSCHGPPFLLLNEKAVLFVDVTPNGSAELLPQGDTIFDDIKMPVS
jgi:hypothetical protein